MEPELFGLAGMVLIIIAWIPGLVETITTKKPGMGRKFMLLDFLGSVLLGYYALLLNSLPFLILNIIAVLVPIVHFYYSFKNKK